jgi:type 1 glutamine amidotransferase
MTGISIQVDPDVAQTYNSFPVQRQQQIQLIFNLFLKCSLEEEKLENIVADIRQEVQANGLTPEILENLLADDRFSIR